MSYAEFIAGTTFNSSSLGFIHSMSHAMSAVFNTPHGLANATIMPFVLEYELKNKKVAKKLCEISDGMGITNPFNDKISKANYCIKTIREFITGLGVPTSLVEVQKNITDRQINQMSKKAMKDFCGISNPIQFSRRQVKQIYRNAIKGII
jgi:alcohol dehydrogenase class IV